MNALVDGDEGNGLHEIEQVDALSGESLSIVFFNGSYQIT